MHRLSIVYEGIFEDDSGTRRSSSRCRQARVKLCEKGTSTHPIASISEGVADRLEYLHSNHSFPCVVEWWYQFLNIMNQV